MHPTSLATKPGQGQFHSLVLHMSKANTFDKPRCAIICDYDPSPHPCLDAAARNDPETKLPAGIHADGVWPLRGGR